MTREATPEEYATPERAVQYPLFGEPAKYLRVRAGWSGLGWLKRWSEHRALDRCLDRLDGSRAVCDCPCGPGRLFEYWGKRFETVIGVDLSEPMLPAAAARHEALGLRGEVRKGDAFDLAASLNDRPDLVASVRFLYYFGRERRAELLRCLAAASRRYVLVQYKTAATYRGRRTQRREMRRKGARFVKQYCSYAGMAEEVQSAGLKLLRIQPIGFASDRVFVLAERSGGCRDRVKG